MNLKAINNLVLVEEIEPRKVSEIIVVTAEENTNRWGRALSVGPGVPSMTGQLVPPRIKEKQILYMMAHGKEPINLGGSRNESGLFFLNELDILGVIEDEETMKFKPLGHYVVIDKIEDEERDVIQVAENAKRPTGIATVTELGYGWTNMYGEPIPFQVKEADKIAFRQFNTLIVDMTPLGIDKKIHLVGHNDILGVFEE